MNTLVKYVVTDPCYILNNDTWDECCKFLDDSPKAFNEAVSKALTDLTGFPAYVCDTGFGDWNNKIYGSYIIHKEFCADSGMVCVCRLTSEIENHFAKEYSDIYSRSAAVFEGSEDINVDFDISDPSWTVVKIHDNQTGNFIETMSADDFYSENEDFDDEDDNYFDEEEDY